MKILYIITLADGGGAQNYTLSLAKHFKGAVAAGTEEQKLFTDARSAGLATFGLKHLKRNISPVDDLLAIFEMAKLIKQAKPDLVHLNSTKAGFLGSIAARLTGTKVVFTAHGFHFNEPLSPVARRVSLSLEKFASLFRSHIIAVSQADYNSAIIQHVTNSKKISVVHNGIAPISFLNREESRKQLGLPKDKFIFGTVANFYPAKGLDVLLEAIALLPEDLREKISFAIIGNGPEELNLEARIKNLGIENHVKLIKDIPISKPLLHAFDAYAMPSRKEGLPFALLEAMQAGLPMIASKVGGIPEALGDAGLMVQPENPHALAEAIKKISADDNLRQRLGSLASSRSVQFSEENMFAETQKIYDAVLKKQS